MDEVVSLELIVYWNINKGESRNVTQKDLKDKYQFFKLLVEINSDFTDNRGFISQVQRELLRIFYHMVLGKGDPIK